VVSTNEFGERVHQLLVNYQDGVSAEITGNGSAALGGQGGNGAMRLLTIDPDNDVVHAETYITELDTYLTATRGGEAFERDGLTGPYRNHEETLTDVSVGDREAQTVARAGDDQLVQAEGETGTITLSAARTVDAQSDVTAYVWRNAEGEEVARGEEATVELGGGIHDLTLEVQTARGVSSFDDVRVIVKTDDVLLVETFDDGRAEGWRAPADLAAPQIAEFGTDPALGGGTPVAEIDALDPETGLLVRPSVTGPVTEYTLVFDMLVEPGETDFAALFQTDVENASDAELFLRDDGDGTAGIGISGQYDGAVEYGEWHRLAFAFEVGEDGAHLLRKHVDGVLVGTQTVADDAYAYSRWAFQGEYGFLLFSDESGETAPVTTAGMGFVPEALDDATIAALGPAGEGFEVGEGVRLDFDGALDGTDAGAVFSATAEDLANRSPMLVKGSAASRFEESDRPATQGALFDQSDEPGNILLWTEDTFGDHVIEATLRSRDDDAIGLVFRFGEGGDHYRLDLDLGENLRRLVKVEDGEEIVLASETGGYRYDDSIAARVSVVGGEIAASLDGVPLFGGPVVDDDPLPPGRMGVYASEQREAQFDDVVVRAHTEEAVAGPDRLLIDFDGDGTETAVIDARLSTGEATIAGAEGEVAEVTASGGTQSYEVAVGDDIDTVTIEVASGDRLIAADRFEDGDLDGWAIVDTTEIGGPADWGVEDGALVERSGASSEELLSNGANNPDVWQRGWSPQGDGAFALHKGTYALWDGDRALEDHLIEARIEVPSQEGAVGFMLNWIDADSYLKLDIDARMGEVRLVEVVDSYEDRLADVLTTYTAGEPFHLRVTHVDDAIQAEIDGHEVFAEPVEAQALDAPGAAGVYAWQAAGARFDDVAIVAAEAAPAEIVGTDGSDRLAGTDGDDVIRPLGGRLDVIRGGEGADIFDFSDSTANGLRETRIVADFEAGETVLLGDASVAEARAIGDDLLLILDGDGDVIRLAGVTDPGDVILP
jgi:hypothetical protein